MSTRTITTMAELPSLVGQQLGQSDWLTIDQERINTFADVTEDHQWIHVDVERAKSGPFGGTLAHGMLTQSLAVGLATDLLQVTDAASVINYGTNRVRFPSPVLGGSRVRLTTSLLDVIPIAGGMQAVTSSMMAVEGSEKPALVAEQVMRYYRAPENPAPPDDALRAASTAA
ncbi:MaoC family dehydratase [Streptomyces olivaceoviridis]|uniref:MaoC family dehydratase n=1 Tax=Streptomyces olivaceoviridis TaxID=1921 RepID=UPI0033B32B03